jgi:hypothetical protein
MTQVYSHEEYCTPTARGRWQSCTWTATKMARLVCNWCRAMFPTLFTGTERATYTMISRQFIKDPNLDEGGVCVFTNDCHGNLAGKSATDTCTAMVMPASFRNGSFRRSAARSSCTRFMPTLVIETRA